MKIYTDGKRHLVCVPYSVENLHLMAKNLQLGRHWFHAGKLAHYDLPIRRKEEIELQCIMVSSKEIVKICKGQTT